MLTVLSHKIVKTRKPCQCFGCLRIIPVGSDVQTTTQVDEGKFSVVRLCEVCCNFVNTYIDYDDFYCEGELKRNEEELWEKIRQETEEKRD